MTTAASRSLDVFRSTIEVMLVDGVLTREEKRLIIKLASALNLTPEQPAEIYEAIRTKTEGPVVTSVVRMISETQLDELHKSPNLRVNVFPLGLEEIFIDLFGPEAKGEFGDMQL